MLGRVHAKKLILVRVRNLLIWYDAHRRGIEAPLRHYAVRDRLCQRAAPEAAVYIAHPSPSIAISKPPRALAIVVC